MPWLLSKKIICRFFIWFLGALRALFHDYHPPHALFLTFLPAEGGRMKPGGKYWYSLLQDCLPNYHYFIIQTVSTTTAIARTKTSLIYYVMCLGARFYDYLASSDVKIKSEAFFVGSLSKMKIFSDRWKSAICHEKALCSILNPNLGSTRV
jgi:hypothetical protein